MIMLWYSLVLAQHSLLNFLTKRSPDAGAPLIMKNYNLTGQPILMVFIFTLVIINNHNGKHRAIG